MDTLNSMLCLNEKYSTTRNLTTEKPIIKNHPDDKFETVLFLPEIEGRKGEGGLRTQGYFKKSLSDKPLVTVVTVVYNGEQHLEETILSVLNQTYNNVEYIIIDGGSNDRTLEIIKKYEDDIDYWISEPDKGIYGAMNKGISLSNGQLIGLINSGDFYEIDAIENIVKQYQKNVEKGDKLIITGSMYKLNEEGNIVFNLVKTHKYFTKTLNKSMPISHPATFVSIQTYKNLGYFDEKFKICGDYDFIFRTYYNSDTRFIFTDKNIAHMRLGGISQRLKSAWIRPIEGFLIRKQNVFWLKNTFISIYIFVVLVTKVLVRKIMGNKLMSIYYGFRHGKTKKEKFKKLST